MGHSAVASMTARERYLETLLFGTPDKIPFEPGGAPKSLGGWNSTRSLVCILIQNSPSFRTASISG